MFETKVINEAMIIKSDSNELFKSKFFYCKHDHNTNIYSTIEIMEAAEVVIIFYCPFSSYHE
jgi:hypothetical protein